MKKKKIQITREIIIMMVIFILIMLIMAVALYDFIPTNINIIESISYASDSKTTSIKQEIIYANQDDTDEEKAENVKDELKSYSIQASELTVYSEKNLYNKGNSNPFDYATEEVTNPQTQNNANTNQTATNTTTTTNQTVSNGVNNTNTVGGTTTPQANNASITSQASGTTTGTFFEKPSSK